ncbi:MAG: caspase family protein, partial [Planctomycetales bacterium]|nr:caspase family protein [Planctomycetales bacterium]
NGIYPIWFVWETGFLESVWQTFQGSTREVRALEAPRGWTDVTDRIWESVARRLGPKLLWSGMKRSAQLSFAAGGGGRDFAGQLAQFCQAWSASPLELHAAIHSAGSIFFAHGLPYMLDNGVPNIRGLHLMAPAIRNDLFRRRLLDRMNNGIDWTTIYTMRRNLELDDSVGPYGKSLLYLIHYALEDDRETPILGLEESLRRDTAIATKFGLRGTSNQAGDVLWSKTPRDTDRNSTRATSHGDFDNDPTTLNSIVMRIKGLSNQSEIVPYVEPSSRAFHLLEAAADRVFLREPFMGDVVMASQQYGFNYYGSGDANRSGPSGGRKALCIGIDTYPESPLAGCVNDSNSWANWLRGQGYKVNLLQNGQATRSAMLNAIESIITSASAGDVIAIQYSGHGTQVPDFDGDERNGDTPGFDEALVPVDHRRNGYVIDDDLGAICGKIPAGVNVTFFMDCCHSGTNTRVFGGVIDRPSGDDARKRFLPADAEMIATHIRTRQTRGRNMRNLQARDSTQNEVAFAACRSDQVAWESNGQGDFTRHALKVLSSPSSTLTNDGFLRAVVSNFGSSPRQNPELHCDASHRATHLLAPRVSSGGGTDSGNGDGKKNESFRDFLQDLKGLVTRYENS